MRLLKRQVIRALITDSGMTYHSAKSETSIPGAIACKGAGMPASHHENSAAIGLPPSVIGIGREPACREREGSTPSAAWTVA